MKVRVCKENGQYYVEYYKFWLWHAYTEDFGAGCETTVYFSDEEKAINFAKQLASDKVGLPRVIWESE